MATTKKIRVFLADDHLVLREGIKSFMSRVPDMEVIGEASNGEDTVAKVRQLVPDIVLMDISMPGINGLEAAAQIKQLVPQTKVLVLTMYETEQYVSQMLHVGAVGYVVKTASTDELLSAIRTVYHGDVYLYPSITRMFLQDYLQNIKMQNEDKPEKLTARELEILRHVADARKNKEIADILGISVRTVQAHRTNLMFKLGVHDRTELVKYAVRKGLINL